PSIALPKYRRVRVAPGGVTRIRRLLQRFAPDVVHLASPFVLGWRGVLAAQALGLPTVAIYQTEVPASAARYGMHGIEALLWNHVRNIPQHSSLTLAPSSYTIDQLSDLALAEVALWARGVDSSRFGPGDRSEAWRRTVAPNCRKIIGFAGRLAAEKQVEDLAALTDVPGARLVIVGDGPWRTRLARV